MLVAVPIKSFDTAKGRLGGVLDGRARADLARRSAAHVLAVARRAGTNPAVVTDDEAVTRWAADHHAAVIADPGLGLDEAARRVVAVAEGPWCVVHGDLPLLRESDLRAVTDGISRGAVVLCPSRDGGTNVLGGTEPMAFSYGPGSFSRHLAAAASLPRTIVLTPGTVIDIDGPDDLIGASRLAGGEWLRSYLPSRS
jgi:2-phospho-L-lactate guanylyltransferase